MKLGTKVNRQHQPEHNIDKTKQAFNKYDFGKIGKYIISGGCKTWNQYINKFNSMALIFNQFLDIYVRLKNLIIY